MFNDAPKCEVLDSLIHGKGLFAVSDIEKDEIVVNYDLTGVWEEKRFENLTKTEIEKCWWVGLDKNTCLVPRIELKFFYSNHSKSPNCHWDRVNKRLIALKNIKIEEEITYDYNLEIKPDNWIKFNWLK